MMITLQTIRGEPIHVSTDMVSEVSQGRHPGESVITLTDRSKHNVMIDKSDLDELIEQYK